MGISDQSFVTFSPFLDVPFSFSIFIFFCLFIFLFPVGPIHCCWAKLALETLGFFLGMISYWTSNTFSHFSLISIWAKRVLVLFAFSHFHPSFLCYRFLSFITYSAQKFKEKPNRCSGGVRTAVGIWPISALEIDGARLGLLQVALRRLVVLWAWWLFHLHALSAWWWWSIGANHRWWWRSWACLRFDGERIDDGGFRLDRGEILWCCGGGVLAFSLKGLRPWIFVRW